MIGGDQGNVERVWTFVETTAFRKAWKACGLSDSHLFEFLRLIADDPRAGRVIKDTGGLRKLRFRATDSSVGKRGAFRVCYVNYDEIRTVLLVTAFAKNDASDLSPEARKMFKAMIQEQKKIIRQRGRL